MKKYFLLNIVSILCSLQISANTEVCIDSLAENYFPYLDPASPFYNESLLSTLDVNNEVCTYINPYHFNYDITDINASIIFPSDIESNILIPDSSILGAFYLDNDLELRCGGSTIWNAEEVNGISIWGEDTYSVKNGFSEGESIEWKLITTDGDLFDVELNFYSSSNTYFPNSLYIASQVSISYEGENEYPNENLNNSICINPNACNFTNEMIGSLFAYNEGNCLFPPEACTLETNTTNPIKINLRTGWSTVSYYLPHPSPVVAQFESQFGSETAVQDNINIVKNNEGLFYWPDFLFDGIGMLQPGQGYKVSVKNSSPGNSNFIFDIDINSPGFDSYEEYISTPIIINLHTGWNLIGYQHFLASSIEQQLIENFGSIENVQNNIQIIKDNYGNFYWPEFNYSRLEYFTPGEGYHIRIKDSSAGLSNFYFINPVYGCTDVTATNFNNNATINDISCIYPETDICDSILNIHQTEINYLNDSVVSLNNTIALLNEFLDLSNTQNYHEEFIPIYLPQGWGMFGFTCLELMDVEDAFFPIVDKLIIVKDNDGNAYLPEYNFNGLGDLIYSRGYQLKTTEEIVNFSFCPTVIPGVEGCIDEIAFNYNSSANMDDGSCYSIVYGCMNPIAFNFNDYDNDGVGDYITGINGIDVNTDNGTCIPVIEGCTEINAVNFNQFANTDNGSCIEVVLGCTGPDHCNYNPEANTDDGSCIYPEQGYDCYGNIVPQYQVGDYAEGGIVFYVDETGEYGLVAAMEDLGEYAWGCFGTELIGADGQAIGTGYQNTLDIVTGCSDANIAAFNALNASTEGYTDWYLPSFDELYEMYNTIGNGGPEGNIGGFENFFYWSSSEYNNGNAWFVNFINGLTDGSDKTGTGRVRVIRAF